VGPERGGDETPAADEAGLDRIWTIPNLLSLARIGLLVVFCWLLFRDHERVAATVVLMVTGTTDFLDGFVARRLHQVTTLGKVLDPTADRIVLATSVIAVAAYGAVPWWLAGVVLGREILVSGAVLALAALGARRIDVLWAGKVGTFGLLVCFPSFLLSDTHAHWASVLHDIAWGLMVPALAFSFAAAVSYVPIARRVLAERSVPPAEAVTS
jgi:cardiolipin synthase (CMP-forming)